MSGGVAVVGLGAMGLPMAGRLAELMPVTAFDPVAERRGLARDLGATPHDTAAGATRGASHVVVAVRDGRQLEQALFGPDGAVAGLGAGGAVIVTSTVGRSALAAVAERLAGAGLATIDAPVSGGDARARQGALLLMVSGEESVLAGANEVLTALGAPRVVGASVGDAQLVKTVNQLLCGVHTAAAGEAIALAQAVGLDVAVVIDLLGLGAAASFMLADRGPRMAEWLDGGVPEVRSRLDVIDKDMALVLEAARAARVPVPLAATAAAAYQRGMAARLEGEDDSVVVTLHRPAADPPEAAR